MSKAVPVGLIQMSCGDDIGENMVKAIGYVNQAADEGAKIICTQELFKSRYFCQAIDLDVFRLAEKLGEHNPTVQSLSDLARRREVVIIASVFEKRAAGLYYNTAVVIDADGSLLGKYRKMHIPDDPHYLEKFYFTPGDLGYLAFRTRYANVGVLICWDQWFPEAARLTALRGAEIIFYPTAIGYMPGERERGDTRSRDAWQVVQRGHAVANGCFVAAVNRVGYEPHPEGKGGLDFWGQSFVTGPYGTVLADAAKDQDEVLVCSLDLAQIEEARDQLAHFYRDRRIDSYNELTKRYLA
ncbi:MAG: carbon-nitrogen hydrolase [Anaerolineae bacterium]|jgi:N-carbamoylputrescine amidase